jgi:hypothetical protein
MWTLQLGFVLSAKVPWKLLHTSFWNVIWLAFCGGPLLGLFQFHFSSRPIAGWILAIIFPEVSLGISKYEVKKFQLYAALMLDSI